MKIPFNTLTSVYGLFVVLTLWPMISKPELPGLAQTSEPFVAERGPHHRVWQRSVQYQTPSGRPFYRTNTAYVELATGLHYQDEDTGRWMDSKELIEIVDDGAVARKTPHKVKWLSNLNVLGALDVRTPDGKRLRTHILGLAYSDAASGQSVLFAETKDCLGEALLPNQVIYRDAFQNVMAMVRYTLTKAGIEQDVVFLENPPSPADFGLDPDTTRLEVWTEFFDPPNPAKQVRPLEVEADPAKRQGMAEPDLLDEQLDFGQMSIGAGRAFSVDENQAQGKPTKDVAVGKTWGQAEGRHFLIEKVNYPDIKEALDVLPKTSALSTEKKDAALVYNFEKDQIANLVARARPVSKNPTLKGQAMQVASLSKKLKGVVLDYSLLASSNNFTFQGGTTYYVSGPVNLSGETTIEAGTVVKFTNSPSAGVSAVKVTCTTTPYCMAVFTSMHDNTVGETIPNSTGSPQAGSYDKALGISTNGAISNIRCSYANYGIYFSDTYSLYLTNVQILYCSVGFFAQYHPPYVTIYNSLFYNIGTIFNGYYGITGYNLTLRRAGTCAYGYSGSTLSLVNCLAVAVTNWCTNPYISVTSNYTARIASDSGVFQTAGAGYCYLADNSPYRNCGSTNVYSSLLRLLAAGTTYPPVVINTNAISVDTVWFPQVQRDTDQPDLGYHYAPLDYAVTMNTLSNAVLLMTNGVAVATYGLVGIYVMDNGHMVSVGSPLCRNHIGKYNTVQEQSVFWNYTNSPETYTFLPYHYTTNLGSVEFRFTDFDALAGPFHHIYQGYCMPDWSVISANVRDCEFYNGWAGFGGLPSSSVNVTNNLFHRTIAYFDNDGSMALYNNLFRGGGAYFNPDDTYTNWIVKDCVFDRSGIDDWEMVTNRGYNAYINTSTYLGGSSLSTDKLLTNLDYDIGALGRFYERYATPSNYLANPLANAGSRLASAASLYHYTTATNQVKETNSQVDIGYHYVALGANGLPVDSDWDGLADYLEDINGDGVADSNETSFTNSDTDYDGRSDAQELADGTDPLDPNSSTPVLLGYWKFNSTNWTGEQGQVPTQSNNLQNVASWSGNALRLCSIQSSRLRYREIETNCSPNINCRGGTVSFWFNPLWSSPQGPQSMARLVEVGAASGDASYGDWAVCVDSGGTNLLLLTEANGVRTTNVSAVIDWRVGNWRHVAVTYGTTSASLYVDGQLLATGSGITHFPSATVRSTDGFGVGSDKNGTNQAQGTFDELNTCNYPLTSAQITSEYQAGYTQLTNAPAPAFYPIAIKNTRLMGVQIGTYLQVTNKGADGQLGSGSFGWLSWNRDLREDTMASNLTNGNAGVIFPDSIPGLNGVSDNAGLRSALDYLANFDIVVPVWDSIASTNYHIITAARIRLVSNSLASPNILSLIYLGTNTAAFNPFYNLSDQVLYQEQMFGPIPLGTNIPGGLSYSAYSLDQSIISTNNVGFYYDLNNTYTSMTPSNNIGESKILYVATDGLKAASASMKVMVQTSGSGANTPTAHCDYYRLNSGSSALSVPIPGVLGNDYIGSGRTLTAELNNTPSHGQVTLNANGSFIYTPESGYVGRDIFTYQAVYTYNGTAYRSAVTTVTVDVMNCTPSVDVVFVIDKSGTVGGKLSIEKDTAKYLAPKVHRGTDGDRVGIVSFCGTFYANLALTSDPQINCDAYIDDPVHMVNCTGTKYSLGINAAKDMLTADQNGAQKVIILLSDFQPNLTTEGEDVTVSYGTADVAKDQGIRIIAIKNGYFNDYQRPLMTNMASSSSDAYYAPSPLNYQTLDNIWNSVESYICRPPTIGATALLGPTLEDTAYSISYAQLVSASEASSHSIGTLQLKLLALQSGSLNVTLPYYLQTGQSVLWTPSANQNGLLDAFTVKAYDGYHESLQTCLAKVDVTAVNDAPTLNPFDDIVLAATSLDVTQTVQLSGITSGAANETQTLSVSAASSHPSILPNPTVSYVSPNSQGTLTFTFPGNTCGDVIFTVTVHDNGGVANEGQDTFSRTFHIRKLCAPVIQLNPNPLSYTENEAPKPIDNQATLTDGDTSDFIGSLLWVEVSNAEMQDHVNIPYDGGVQFEVMWSGVGTYGVHITGPALVAAMQNLIRKITYWNSSDSPITTPRHCVIHLAEADGCTSGQAGRDIQIQSVNDASAISFPGTGLGFFEASPPMVVNSQIVLTDVDTTDFNGATLTITLGTTGIAGEDLLGFKNQSSGTPDCALCNPVLDSDGNPIGYVFNWGAYDLGIQFTETVTPQTIQELLRSITYWNMSDNPSSTQRSFIVRLTEADGITATDAATTIDVYPINNAPRIDIQSPLKMDLAQAGWPWFFHDKESVGDIARLPRHRIMFVPALPYGVAIRDMENDHYSFIDDPGASKVALSADASKAYVYGYEDSPDMIKVYNIVNLSFPQLTAIWNIPGATRIDDMALYPWGSGALMADPNFIAYDLCSWSLGYTAEPPMNNLNQPSSIAVNWENFKIIITDEFGLKIWQGDGFLDYDFGPCYSVVLSQDGTKAYVAAAAGFIVVNVEDISDPYIMSSVDGGINGEPLRPLKITLSKDGRKAYCAGQTGLQVLDISNPESPQHVGTFPQSAGFTTVVLDDEETAAFAGGNPDYYYIDISTYLATTTANTPTAPIVLHLADPDNVDDDLTIQPWSSNEQLVPLANIQITEPTDYYRNLVITPAPNQSGEATIELTVSDGQLSSRKVIKLTVLPALTISIIAPANGSFYANTPVTIPITASLHKGDGTGHAVDFFVNDVKVGARSSPTVDPDQYTVNWKPVVGTTYTLRAKVTDNLGETAESAPVTITVNQDPTVHITSPAQGRIYEGPTATLTIEASASDPDGSISQVEFRMDGTPLGTDSTPPYEVAGVAATLGTHKLTAVATDNQGGTRSSPAVLITVRPANQPPTVNAGPDLDVYLGDAVILTGIASDDSLPVGSTLTLQWSQDSGPAGVSFTAPASAVTPVTFPAAGTYQLKLTASDGVLSSSDTVTVEVDAPNEKPIVNAGEDKTLCLPADTGSIPVRVVPNTPAKDHKGTSFWFMVPGTLPQNPNTHFLSEFVLLITADEYAKGSLTYKKTDGTDATIEFVATCEAVTRITIPYEDLEVATSTSDGSPVAKGLHVISDKNIGLRILCYNKRASDGALVYPQDSLGTEYIIATYPNNPYLGIVAAEGNTTVTIQLPGQPSYDKIFDIAGKCYFLAGGTSDDFTGTTLHSTKPIAVFSGCLSVNIPANYGYANTLIEQMPPLELWGTRYAAQPFAGRNNYDKWRIYASATGTDIKKDGVSQGGIKGPGEKVELTLTQPCIITANNPILVVQYASSMNYDNFSPKKGDPTMIVLPCLQQGIYDCVMDIPIKGFRENWVNLMVANEGVSSLYFNNSVPSSSSFHSIGTSGYSWAAFNLTPGINSLRSAYPFVAYNYGWETRESYGYACGMTMNPVGALGSINAALANSTLPVGAEQCVTVTALKKDGTTPLPRLIVNFQMSGQNGASSTGVTGNDGVVRFYFTGLHETSGGSDLIAISAGDLTPEYLFPEWTEAVVYLNGTASDPDNQPAALSVGWSQVEGPGTVSFSPQDNPQTYASFSEPGIYTLRLSANDGDQTVTDDVVVRVAENAPPALSFACQKDPNCSDLTLQGYASDDLTPNNAINLAWTKVSGPGTVTFANPNALQTSARLNGVGKFHVQLTGSDSQLSGQWEQETDNLITVYTTVNLSGSTPITVSGDLNAQDKKSLHRPNSYADYYQFQPGAGQVLVIKLQGNNYLPYMYLYAGDSPDNLRVISTTDEAMTSDGWIIYKVPAAGQYYYLEVTTDGEFQTGSYSLEIQSLANGAPIPISPYQVVYGTIEPEDLHNGMHVDYYVLPMTVNQALQITLDDFVDYPSIYIWRHDTSGNPTVATEDSEGTVYGHVEKQFIAPANDDYVIGVVAPSGNVFYGRYMLLTQDYENQSASKIRVSYGGSPVENGGQVVLTQPIRNGKLTRLKYEIRNTGTADLNLSSLNVTATSGNVTIASDPASHVVVGGATEFVLEYMDNIPGANKHIHVSIASDVAAPDNSFAYDTVLEVAALAAPVITIPVDGQGFGSAPADISITVSPAESAPAEIVRVDLYAMDEFDLWFIGSGGAPPFTLNWARVEAGDYTLTARGFDADGAWADSDPVSISVGQGSLILGTTRCPNFLNRSRTVTAQFYDNNGNAAAGRQVQFNVSGANPCSGTGTTDDKGRATYTYTGINPGKDVISANATDSHGLAVVAASLTQIWPAPLACMTDANARQVGTTFEGSQSLSVAQSSAAYYQIAGAAGQSVIINMESTEFYPGLLLWNAQCQVVPPSGGTQDSHRVYTLPADGEYIIEAMNLGKVTAGQFNIGLVCGTFPVGPEISVSTEGVTVPNNGWVTFTPGVAADKTFTIKNLGLQPLTISGATQTGSAQFSLTTVPSSPVPAGQSTTFVVHYAGSSTPQEAAFIISNNDADNGDGVENPYTIQVSASAPTLTISPPRFCPSLPNADLSYTATLLDNLHQPIAGQPIQFTVTGPNATSQTRSTDGNGQASLILHGQNPGADRITASTTLNNSLLTSEEASADWAQPIEPFQTVAAHLETSDGWSQGCNCAKPNRYADYYWFHGEAGQTATITMKANGFDSLLYLRSGCTVLANNNDISGSDHNSQIVYQLPETGDYMIEATSFDMLQTGDYTLLLNWGAPSQSPEIEVWDGDRLLTNYSTIKLSVGLLDTTISRPLVIRNVGTGDLKIDDIIMSGDGDFEPLNEPDPVLGPGAAVVFSFGLYSTVAGTYHAKIRINSNDADNGDGVESPFIITINGIVNPDGISPEVSLFSPANGATYRLPTTIPIIAAAEAKAPGATISKYELFASDMRIAQNSTGGASYEFDWKGAFAGTYEIFAQVSDNQGRVALSQPITITVLPDLDNHAPTSGNNTYTVAPSSQTVFNVLENDPDPDGDAVHIIGPRPIAQYGTVDIINNGQALRYTAREYTVGSDGFSYTVSDDRGGTATAWVSVNIINMPTPHVSWLEPNNGSSIASGTTVNLKASAPAGMTVSFYVDNELVGQGTPATGSSDVLYTLAWQQPIEGDHFLYARVQDGHGQERQSEAVFVNIFGNSEDPLPIGVISSPAPHAIPSSVLFSTPVIREAQCDVFGRVYAFDVFNQYNLSYQLKVLRTDGTTVANITRLPDESGFHSINDSDRLEYWEQDQLLGTMDLTGLRNDIYELHLIVKYGSRITTATVQFALENEVKIGQFSFSQQDLSIPIGGLSVSVTRTYNSLNSSLCGDFGYGWTYSMSDLNVSLAEYRTTVTDVFSADDAPFSLRVGGSRDVTLTLPDGRRTTFIFELIKCPGDAGEFGLCYQAVWRAEPGVTAKLTMLGDNTIESDFNSFFWHADASAPYDSYDIPGYELQLQDGTRYVISRDHDTELHGAANADGGYTIVGTIYGEPKLTEIITPSNGEISFGNQFGSLQYVNPAGASSSPFKIQRSGRVITSLAPSDSQDGPPLVKYEYDSKTNLIKVLQLVDKTGVGTYLTNRYEYNRPQFPHYITDIFDAREVAVSRTIYDNNGKMIGITDASGVTHDILHDLVNRQETVYDQAGNPTVYYYDLQGNVVMKKDCLNNITTTTYDSQNNVKTEKDALLRQTTYDYEYWSENPAAYKKLTTTLPSDSGAPAIINYQEFNLQGQVTKSVDAKHYVVSGQAAFYTWNEYDTENGNLLQVVAHWSGTPVVEKQLQRFIYYPTNEAGQFDASAASLNGLLRYSYDALGNRTTYKYYNGEVGGRIRDLWEVAQFQGNNTTPIVRTSYEYDANGNRTKETVTDGSDSTINSITQYIYDPLNRVKETIDGAGGHIYTVYDPSGKSGSTTDRYGAVTRYTYNALGDLIETQYPDNTIARSVIYYDTQPGTTRKVKHIVAEERHYRSGLVAGTRKIQDEAGRVVRTERLTDLVIDLVPDGNVSKTVFKSATVVSSTQTRHDAIGRVTMSADANGKWTKYDYDGAGRRWREKAFVNDSGEDTADTITTLYGYDQNGNHLWTLDANQYAILTQTLNLNTSPYQVHQLLYGSDGSPSSYRASLTWYEYDEFNRLTTTHYPGGAISETHYDDLGRAWLQIDVDGHATAYVYDALGHLLWTVADVANTLPALPSGPPASWPSPSVRLADSTVTGFQYDGLGRLVAQTDDRGNTTQFRYDSLGRRVKRLLPDQTPTVDTDNSYEEWTYDYNSPPNGPKQNQVRHRDFSGRYSLNTYDSVGRFMSRQTDGQDSGVEPLPPEAARPVAFTYTASGKRETMTEWTQTGTTISDQHITRYIYDQTGRLRIKNAQEGTLTYDYDKAGNITLVSARKTYTFPNTAPYAFSAIYATAQDANPNGALMSYRYDQKNRLWKVNADDTTANSAADATYTFDSLGNLKQVAYRNGVQTDYNYNSKNHLTDMTTARSGSARASFKYDDAAWTSQQRLTPSGMRQHVVETVNSVQRVLNYSYDNLRRLTKEEMTIGPQTGSIIYDTSPGYTDLGYDPVGNRRSRTVSLTPVESLKTATYATYDPNDRLGTLDGAKVAARFDDNGNTLQFNLDDVAGYDQPLEDRYDFENRLIQATRSGGTFTIQYDGDGNRIAKTLGSVTTSYLVDDRNPTGYAQVLEEWTSTSGGSATLNRVYTYGLGLISQKDNAAGTASYYGYDVHGSVRFLTDATLMSGGAPGPNYGQITDTYVYDAFGVLISTSDTANPPRNVYRFAGEQWDPDLGLYYNRARYYNPDTGRFWTMDTYEGNQSDPLSLHKYLYCANNPVNRVDPSGHDFTAVGQVGNVGIQITIQTAYLQQAAFATATALTDYYSRQQLFLFHVTDATIVKIALQYNQGAFRTANSTKPMFFATTSTHVASLLLYGIGYPVGMYLGGFESSTTLGIKSFAEELGIPYASLSEELKKPKNKPVIILTSKKNSITGKIWFNGGIRVEGNLYAPLIYSTFRAAEGEMVRPENYKLIPLP